MRIFCIAVISLSVVLNSDLATQAQDVAASPDEVARCANWVKETVPADLRISGTDFCTGIKRDGSPNGWSSIQNCGEQPGSDKPLAGMFCASSGQVGPDWTIAAGYTGAGPDGREFISGTHAQRTSGVATLYSRTPLHIGNTSIPAGFSQLTLSHIGQAWQLAILPEKEKVARTVQLVSDTRQLSATGKELAIGIHYNGPRCSDPANMRELVFTYAGTDLYVCMLPDHIAPMPNETAAMR